MWPTTVAHDGSDAVVSSLPRGAPPTRRDRDRLTCYGPAAERGPLAARGWQKRGGIVRGYGGDTDSVSRYFYVAQERDGLRRRHPTQKPLPLMRWLVRLLCPPGGVILDPYAGGGTTCLAALAEGRGYVGIELDPRYHAAAEAALRECAEGSNARQD